MKVLALIGSLLLTMTAQASLRLDCSSLTPKEILILKPTPKIDPCEGKGTAIVALTGSGVLHLCRDSKTVERFDISIGRAGSGKLREGDLKTPLGVYALGRPKTSERFGLFIPVAYPTLAQKAKGLTGGDIGIHGPDRRFACAGALNVSFNWTQGCMAVADDRFILAISDFVKSNPKALLFSLE